MDVAKKKIIKQISKILKKAGCSLAVLFGSFVENETFRDIDIMIAMAGGRPPAPEETLYLSQLLEFETGYRFDIIGIDIPGVLIRSEIAQKGCPIILKQPELWDEFCFLTWIDEKDFRPLIERFYEERFGIKQGQDS